MLAINLGTRPEITNMVPIILICGTQSEGYSILYAEQHSSYEMGPASSEGMELLEPKYNLDVGFGTHAAQIGKVMTDFGKSLLEEKPEIVLIHGDTSTALGGTLASSNFPIKVDHLVTGPRCFTRTMPKESNQGVSGHCGFLAYFLASGRALKFGNRGTNS